MKHCTKCGKEIGSEDIFCSSCGTKVNGDTENNGQDKSIKADLKVEVTNATTEKAFKKVGETISSGKEAVKTTTGVVKKIIFPVVGLLIVAGIALAIYEQKRSAEQNLRWKKDNEQRKAQRLSEERSCVIQEFKQLENNQFISTNSNWDSVRRQCDLTYTEVENYQKKLGMNLERL